MLDDLLNQYILDPENSDTNYNLAIEYERLGQGAAAVSYFLRASERTSNRLRSYECLLRIGNIFDRQQNRNYTVKSMYRSAMSFLPDRPEAYYLLAKYLNWETNYSEAYLFCLIAKKLIRLEDDIDLGVGYPGKWGLLHEEAISSWWWGKSHDSRKVFQELFNNYWEKMDDYHKTSVLSNIKEKGVGPESYTTRRYTSDKHSLLRYKFNSSETIERNFSQVYQDMFVLSMLNGKRNGTFLEIGAADPFVSSNTYLLEKYFGWKGVSVEKDDKWIASLVANRSSSKIIHADALSLNYSQILNEYFESNVIDYLQLDIDPSYNTFECLLRIPFDKYKFRVITFEHDHYSDTTKIIRQKSREFLKSKGYMLLVNDVSHDDTFTFEDWWIHPNLVDEHIKDKMMSIIEGVNAVEGYFLSSENQTDTTSKDETKNIVVGAYQKYDNQLCWGWCTLDKAGCFVDYIDDICNRVEDPVCVEIGVFGGKSVLPVALELKRHGRGILHAIDPWKNDEAIKGYDDANSKNYWSNVDFQSIYNFFLTLLKEYDVEKYVNVLAMTSDDAPEIKDIDFLYIDGQHTEQSHRDTLKYATQVVLNGYCVVDDVEWGEVSKVPGMLEALGFVRVHSVDRAYVYKRVSLVNYLDEENSQFKINVNMSKRAFIVDNFYNDPHAVRKFAQEQQYIQGGIGRGFIGKRTEKQFLFPGLKEAFQSIMGKTITKWEEHGMNGRFQINIGGEPLVYHCDSQKYAAMIYLTPNAPPSCGTSTFMHKKTRVHHNSDPKINEVFYGIKTTMDGTPYERVDSFGNIFNRLVIFDAGCIHAASEYFGADIEDGRLWHMFFFDAE